MSTWITLIKRTPKGLEAIDQSPQRSEMVRKLVGEHGGKVLGAWAMTGPWDMCWVTEFQDEQTSWQVLTMIQSMGYVTLETYQGIPVEQYNEMLVKGRDMMKKQRAA
jgi:uncharacterized protein with GYD domain